MRRIVIVKRGLFWLGALRWSSDQHLHVLALVKGGPIVISVTNLCFNDSIFAAPLQQYFLRNNLSVQSTWNITIF